MKQLYEFVNENFTISFEFSQHRFNYTLSRKLRMEFYFHRLSVIFKNEKYYSSALCNRLFVRFVLSPKTISQSDIV